MKYLFGILVLALLLGGYYFLAENRPNETKPSATIEIEKVDPNLIINETNNVGADIVDNLPIEQCYEYTKSTEDITQEKYISITYLGEGLYFAPEPIEGFISGSMQSVEYSVGYKGTFTGTVSGNGYIESVASIEIADGGSIQQQEHYQLTQAGLIGMEYALKEDATSGLLYIDESITDNGQGVKFPIETYYKPIDCN